MTAEKTATPAMTADMQDDNSGHVHDHSHHNHGHEGHSHHQPEQLTPKRILTIRCHSGLAGDIMLTGFSRLLGKDNAELNAMAVQIMPELDNALHIEPCQVSAIGGYRARVDLPHQHEHRTLADIVRLLEKAELKDAARSMAIGTFTLLAEAEGRVHGKKPDEVHFHEVGALDSILDITLACMLFDELHPDLFQVSPLPVADGSVTCQHGILPVPAPAVLELLDGIPVVPFAGKGETVTPTAIALLKSLGAQFGPWPAMLVEKHVLAFGTKVFDNAPNGAIFALGKSISGC